MGDLVAPIYKTPTRPVRQCTTGAVGTRVQTMERMTVADFINDSMVGNINSKLTVDEYLKKKKSVTTTRSAGRRTMHGDSTLCCSTAPQSWRQS